MRTSFLAALFTAGVISVAAAEDFSRYGLDLKTTPRPAACAPVATTLPLLLRRGDHVCLIGNRLFERAALFGDIPTTLYPVGQQEEPVKPEGAKRKPAQAASFSRQPAAAAGSRARPNIVLFLADDLGYG